KNLEYTYPDNTNALKGIDFRYLQERVDWSDRTQWRR
ncbi:unnamed protein product, partial [marine sediment metagenome]